MWDPSWGPVSAHYRAGDEHEPGSPDYREPAGAIGEVDETAAADARWARVADRNARARAGRSRRPAPVFLLHPPRRLAA